MKPELLRREQLLFNDVTEGTAISPLLKGPYTPVDMAKFASMYGDFYPGHYDSKWAVEIDRIPKAIVHGYQLVTHLSQLLTDWISPDGFIRKLSTQVRAQVFVGDSVTMKGIVQKKYIKDGESCLDCSVWGEKPDGTVVIQGTAVVILPDSQTVADR
ncbi:MAG: MaoC/PaaZ C-terminal domain-containing protein [Chloroflexota bacterium]